MQHIGLLGSTHSCVSCVRDSPIETSLSSKLHWRLTSKQRRNQSVKGGGGGGEGYLYIQFFWHDAVCVHAFHSVLFQRNKFQLICNAKIKILCSDVLYALLFPPSIIITTLGCYIERFYYKMMPCIMFGTKYSQKTWKTLGQVFCQIYRPGCRGTIFLSR